MHALQRGVEHAKCLAGNMCLKLMDGGDESGASRRSSPKEPDLFLAGVTGQESVKIVVTGYRGVGKTSYVHKCAGVSLSTEYEPTKALQEFGMQVHSKEGGTVNVTFVDVPDGEAMSQARLDAYRSADAFIMMFDLTAIATMMYIKTTVFPEIMEARGLGIAYDDLHAPCLLLGNKLDQAQLVQGGLALREVSEDQAMEVASVIKCPYREVSILSTRDVNNCFREFLTTTVDFQSTLRHGKKAKRKCNVQ